MIKATFIVFSLLVLYNCYRFIDAFDVCTTEEFSNGTLRKTIPLSSEELSKLIDELQADVSNPNSFTNETHARFWMDKLNYLMAKLYERGASLLYQYNTNLTNENSELVEEFSPIIARANQIIYENGKKFYENSNSWDVKLRRMFYLAEKVGISDPNITAIVNNLTSIYSNAKVCKPNSTTCLELEPGLSNFIANSRNNSELTWAWEGWYDATGPYMKSSYVKLVEFSNEAAKKKGYKDASEEWMSELEIDNLEKFVDNLYAQLKPLYEQLHAYVRRKLRNFYGEDIVKSSRIPIQLLGDLWGQDWSNIYDLVVPYPNVKYVNLTQLLKENGYTPLKMFKTAESFFTSIGLCKMTNEFWAYSNIVKPKDRGFVCHASAWTFMNDFDFRIKMCTEVKENHFYVIHHEMGHIEYFMCYRSQPTIFRDGANTAFHEAIGDTIALSVLSPKHLKQINLTEDDKLTHESEINFLMKMALEKIAFAPFGYLVDKWRWNVFKGIIKPQSYNQVWWKMINEFQGLEPPRPRSEAYFDPGAKFHVAANVPYMRYFVALIYQFQFYKALCTLAGQAKPLYECDFFNSIEAGLRLKEMLSLGASEHWTYALNLLTGYKDVSVDALNEYFQPLIDWLKEENSKYPEEKIGWSR